MGTNLLVAYRVTLHFFSLAYLGLHLFVFSCFSGGSWREAVGFDASITSFRLKTKGMNIACGTHQASDVGHNS